MSSFSHSPGIHIHLCVWWVCKLHCMLQGNWHWPMVMNYQPIYISLFMWQICHCVRSEVLTAVSTLWCSGMRYRVVWYKHMNTSVESTASVFRAHDTFVPNYQTTWCHVSEHNLDMSVRSNCTKIWESRLTNRSHIFCSLCSKMLVMVREIIRVT
jgi:hypothetical protein